MMKVAFYKTKSHYRSLLNETIAFLEKICKEEPSVLFLNFYYQLVDLKLNVVELEVLREWDEINQRYSFAGLAAKNLDEDDELRQKLCDVFYGAIHYSEYSED